ncbi:hypothetical protein [Crocosphaera sp. XPORK-15E]|uniref:hypothetical protein n=1 Tax=Crocosphaera sp. XPORK-15E TaxID=3110247 RepID=UPI002B21815F|nr:hypothetical protein [Crocosphaera sp. XPORK-15E]MEA5534278.1 hypothetical protein [Crocosphaera sp. XPORK-15E]
MFYFLPAHTLAKIIHECQIYAEEVATAYIHHISQYNPLNLDYTPGDSNRGRGDCDRGRIIPFRLPLTLSLKGLPIGIQLVGKRGEDMKL